MEKCIHSNIKQYKSPHEFLPKALRKNYNQYKQDAILRADFKNILSKWLPEYISVVDNNMLKPSYCSRDEVLGLRYLSLKKIVRPKI